MTTPPTRRWYAFRLRTLLVIVVVFGCVLTPLAMKVKEARDQKKAVEWVLENGGFADYESGHPPGPKWLRYLLGDDFFQTVQVVTFNTGQISDLTPLSKMSGLQRLHIYSAHVNDLSPLEGLTHLKKLFLGGPQFSDVSSLKGLPNLQLLDLSCTQVSDLSPLRSRTNLRKLHLRATPVRDLSPLSGLTNLEYLDLGDTTVTDEEVRSLQKSLPSCKIIR